MVDGRNVAQQVLRFCPMGLLQAAEIHIKDPHRSGPLYTLRLPHADAAILLQWSRAISIDSSIIEQRLDYLLGYFR